MALFLTEREVVELLPMNECIDVLDEAFAHAGAGQVEIKPRSRIRMPNGFFHFMSASDAEHGVFGYKAYPSFAGPGGSKFLVMLYDFETGQLLALLEAGRLGQQSDRRRFGSGHAVHGQGGRFDRGGVRLRVPGPHPTGGGLRRPGHPAGPGVQPAGGTPRGVCPADERAAEPGCAGGGQPPGLYCRCRRGGYHYFGA